jgi:hypothetical protein
LWASGANFLIPPAATKEFVMSAKKLIVIALAFGGALSATLARASDVNWSVTIGLPLPVPVLHVPVLRPVHLPVPVLRPVMVPVDVPVYAPPVRTVHYYPVPRTAGRDDDHDGIPNRYDRVYNPHWDRDGDGIPNRYDRVYNPRWDRDGDGVPNRYDRRDDRRDVRRDNRWDDRRVHHQGRGDSR